jgi:hypothetical protein
MIMTSPATPPAGSAGPAGAAGASEIRLSGGWLLLARIACGVGALLAVGVFTAGLMLRVTHLGSLASHDVPSGWSTETFRAALDQLGLSVGFYQLYQIALALAFALCCFLVAALLLWRASNEWMALLVALFLLIFGGAWPTNLDALATLYPAWSWLFTLADQLSWALLLAFFFLFPDGRFVPHWVRWWWAALAVSAAFPLFIPPLQDLSLVAWLSFLASALFAQVYRYRRSASVLQRQQIKWIVFGFGATLSAVLGYIALGAIFPALWRPLVAHLLFELAGETLGNLLFLPLALCVGIALLRYRLWGIDRIINQALVYGMLTSLLAAGYAALILGLEGLAGAVSGQASEPLALVVSTVALAAVFLPLRRRVQAAVDRRFYRRKYDAERALAAFGATVRNEVGLNELREHLLAVVQETVQPTHASLWLRPPKQGTGHEPQPISRSGHSAPPRQESPRLGARS